jgi:hypothetical protein
MDWRAEDRFPAGRRDFFSAPQSPDRLQDTPNLLFKGYLRHQAGASSPSYTEVKMAGLYIHSHIRLHCVVLNYLITGTILPLPILDYDHRHHHHWLDSPGWALAFHRSLCHSSLLITMSLQLLMSRALISWRTPSSRLNLGLPIILYPHGLELKLFSEGPYAQLVHTSIACLF